jgi:hypothetical protein
MMAKRFGTGRFQFEVVEGWPKVEIKGVAADVACDSASRVYVGVRNIPAGGGVGNILPGVGHVLVLNPDGSYHSDWGNTFSSPHRVWINGNDEVFVCDTGLHTVMKHAPSGEVLMTLGTRGTPGRPGEPFNMPTSAKQAPNGDLFVSDGYAQNRIHRFTEKGEHILSWGKGDPVFIQRFRGQPVTGTPGTGPGEFNLPHDVTVTADSRVYVLDRENKRWQVFSPEGEYLSEAGGMTSPCDVAIDAEGVFYIVGGHAVDIRNAAGEQLGRWGEQGDEPGQFKNGPHGCWMDPEGSLYIGEVGGNNRLQKFRRV